LEKQKNKIISLNLKEKQSKKLHTHKNDLEGMLTNIIYMVAKFISHIM